MPKSEHASVVLAVVETETELNMGPQSFPIDYRYTITEMSKRYGRSLTCIRISSVQVLNIVRYLFTHYFFV